MIGVLADPALYPVAQELFELFKTPWEFYRDGADYGVVLCNNCSPPADASARLTVIYSGCRLPFDELQQIAAECPAGTHRVLTTGGLHLPIYKSLLTFVHLGVLKLENSGQSVAYAVEQPNGSVVIRVGYDLFDEIEFLLSQGQPLANAGAPTFDLHVSVLRDLILGHGLPLTEIPPVPEGYEFIACLTHDIDHGCIRKHKFDHTMFGFIYRALFGSLLDALGNRRSARIMIDNWLAILKLPFVYLGLAKDFWSDFGAYTAIEGDGRSTFFVIPYAHCAGQRYGSPAPAFRATRYCAADVASQLRALTENRNEVALHGIDAWLSVEPACKEMEEVRRVTARKPVGVRMHWLYFDQNSPRVLEQAGVEYDSTMGYNEAIGYRNGTTQVFKPLTAERLLELPLHVMDTALFSPGRQSLSVGEAKKLVHQILDHAERCGGVVTLNWHDRSIAPERLWGDFYRDLLAELRSRGAWLASAGDTVRWFKKRRSFAFDECAAPSTRSTASKDEYRDLPELCIRTHNAPSREPDHSFRTAVQY